MTLIDILKCNNIIEFKIIIEKKTKEENQYLQMMITPSTQCLMFREMYNSDNVIAQRMLGDLHDLYLESYT